MHNKSVYKVEYTDVTMEKQTTNTTDETILSLV